MIDYILIGMIIILTILFVIYRLMVDKLIKSSDEYANALKEYIKALELHTEILQQEIEILQQKGGDEK